MFKETTPLYFKRVRQMKGVIGTRLLPESLCMQARYRKHVGLDRFEDREQEPLQSIAEGDRWGEHYENAWFHLKAEVPASWAGKPLVAWIDTHTEALIYDADGTILQSISKGSVYDDINWHCARPLVDLSESCQGGETIELWADAGCVGHPTEEAFEGPQRQGMGKSFLYEGRLVHAKIAVLDKTAWALYMDFDVLLNIAESQPENSVRRAKLLRGLTLACDQYGRNPDDLESVRAILAPLFDVPAKASDIKVSAVGHGHLDTGWLWPVPVGRRKFARTVASQLRLMEKYPEHVFGASSALHYRWLKEDHPELYAKVKERIVEKRWEVQGGMWVEADCNMTSGESLIRQFLHGKNFFKQEFDLEMDLLWLPDVFGYSASLPQIMQVCGVDVFMTNKISWSQFTKFQHHTFNWRGIDGTEVLTHFPPEHNYQSDLFADALNNAQERFSERDRLDEMISLFGYGDGGQGPADKHVERAMRLKNIEGCPPVTMGRAIDFFDRLRQKRDLLDTWVGELYLELHRGTLTTHAFVKKANRQLEQHLQALEMLWTLQPLDAYPEASLKELWETLLVNQFHDIIPGTSVQELYEQTYAEYRTMYQQCDQLYADLGACAFKDKADSLTVANTLATPLRTAVVLPENSAGCALVGEDGQVVPTQQEDGQTVAWLEMDGSSLHTYQLEKGKAEAVQTSSDTGVLENDYVRYTFDTNGALVAAYDKVCERAILRDGEHANVFGLYHDLPCQWEAWDTEIFTENERMQTAQCVEQSPVCTGPVRSFLKQTLNIGNSTIEQTISLSAKSKRLDFQTHVSWHEERRLLRVDFPVDITTDTATCDIQFGTLKRPTHRNTIREAAMFEVCIHRFADLSDQDYGVALLNDSKYGCGLHDNNISLSLLKAPVFPDDSADRGEHDFTFSLLPHQGPLLGSSVHEEAAALNRPPQLWFGKVKQSAQASFPIRVCSDTVSLEACKRSEDGKAYVLRLVERAGKQAQATVVFEKPGRLVESDAIEWTTGAEMAVEGACTLTLRAFEIKTWKYYPA